MSPQVEAADERQKKYMRFGKRYMRFGKREDGEEDNLEEEKRYMRFGKREDGDQTEEEKRYMRFGRAQEVLDGLDEEKRYMRFGRAQEADKRWVHQGSIKCTAFELSKRKKESNLI